ncbi:restriction endonuclease subunit S [Bifidobacterium longum]|uniref:restriction endonuclease subunit S n=1 Tax=Bifidobacterium longum TaxID=216816 RepID=UPI0015F75117|nr:restriction endonuclease subunit S [Bifidobacterium longum]
MMVAPKLRFKADNGSEFPAWEKKTLGDIVERVTRKNRDNQTDVPLTISSLDGLVDQRDYFKKTVASKDMSGYFLLQNGEFAYNKSYSVGFDYGSIKRLDKCPCGALSTLYICFGLKPNVDIDSDYLTHYFDSQKWNSEVAAICAEGARNHGLLNVSTSDFFDINIMSPSLPEQRKIADLLSAVDAVIAAQQTEVDAWEQRKKGVMQKLFSQEVRFRADDGSDFPDWEEKTLGEEGQFYGGLSGKGKDDFDCGNGRFVTYMNVYKNTFASRDAMGRVKVGDAEKQNKVRYGDILFTQSSETVDEVGLSSVYLYNDEPYLNSFCMGYRFNNLDNVCPEFIGYCMRSNEIRKSIMLMGQGISRINLGAKRLATVKYKIPSLSEQRKIADCLASMDEVIQKSKGELAKWQELKKGLLQQMFM